MKRKTYAHICVGYEGHECGAITYRLQQSLAHGNQARCPACLKAHKKLYQVGYYIANNEKAREYQKEYHKRHKRASRKRTEYRDKYSNTAKKEEREHTRSSYSHSYIMHSSPEKMLKALDRILSGKAELAAVK